MTLPVSGLVYVDANVVIYSVEQHAIYGPLLQPLWQAAKSKSLEVVSSELLLTETLVGPLRRSDAVLLRDYETALLGTDFRMLPITQLVLREAAQLRATTRLRTPDALHAATALLAGCKLFITNDAGFRSVAGLSLLILDDLLKP